MKSYSFEFTSTLVTKVMVVLLSSLITLITWMIKEQITDMSTTLKSIQTDVQKVSRDYLLLDQKVELKLDSLDTRFNFRLNYIQSKIETLHKEK